MKQNIFGIVARQRHARVAFKTLLGVVVALFALPSLLSAQTLQHRYSFVSDASDSVGTANGTIVAPSGGTAVNINNGLTLAGGGGPGFSGYVTLPGGILTTTTNLTIECWVTQNNGNTWAQIFDFGNSQSKNMGLIALPNRDNGNFELGINPNADELDTIASMHFPTNSEQHITFTFNSSTLKSGLYDNTNLVGTRTFPNSTYVPGSIGGVSGTTNNVFGQDPFPDAQFQGTIYEFRIYNGALNSFQIAVNDNAGPSVVPSYAPASVTLTAGTNVVLTGTEQADAQATVAATGSTLYEVTFLTTNWVSSNPNIVQVNSNGLVTGIGLGTATVSATFGGITATSGPITVTPQLLEHRYSFVSDASDSVGGANGTLVQGTNNLPATITNGLSLPGNTHGGFGYSGYVAFPPGLLTNTTSVTVECWVTQTQANTWAEIWDFANSGSQNFGLIPHPQNNGQNMAVAFTPNGGEVDIDTPTAFPNGSEQYVAVTYNNYSLVGNLYTNGILDASHTFPSTAYCPGTIGGAAGTSQDMLGNDIYGDFQFAGTIYEYRIWNGAVTPVYLAASAVAGSGVVITNTAIQSLSISLSTTSMIGAGIQQATVTGSVLQVSGVPLTTVATNWVSSNPSVLTVNSSGLITAQSGGTATVSATVQGVTATSATITVANTSPTFTQKPTNATNAVNDNVTFSSAALGGGLGYQWSFNGSPITGATSPILVLTNVALTNSGTYSVLVTNNLGSTNASAVLTVVQSILLHRYSFASDASDSVGGANGTLVAPSGGTAATISSGLNLPGNTHGGFGYSGYVSLPNGILTNTASITIETWVTQNSANNWATIWDFADNGNINFELCPFNSAGRNGGLMFCSFDPNNNENDIGSSVAFPNGSEQYVTLTVNAATLAGNLYTNGVLVGTVTLPNSSYLPDNIGGQFGTIQDMLGNDTYGDDQFSGTIYEFRISDGAVTPLYVAVSSAAGPSIVVTNVTPSAVNVTVPNYNIEQGQTEQATVAGNFPQVSGASLNSVASNWISSNTGVLTVNGSGFVTAVGLGTATISATAVGSNVTSATITVANVAPTFSQKPVASLTLALNDTLNLSESASGGGLGYQWQFNGNPIPGATGPTLSIANISFTNAGTYSVVVTNNVGTTNASAVLTVVQAILLHRYSFVSDASDSVGSANGTIIAPNGGTAATISNGLTLPGGGGGGHSGYVAFPGGILTNTTSLTVECWVTQNSANGWATIWDFANDGSHNFEMCPFPQRGILNLDVAIAPHGNELDTITPSLFPSGPEVYTAFTFNAGVLTGSIYTNGVLSGGSQAYPDRTYIPGTIGGANGTSQNWLGNDTFGDTQFQGTIYEFRIWDGAVTPLYLAVSEAAGPSIVVTNLTPTNVTVSVTNSTMVQGQSQPATATGNFTEVSGVNVTSYVTNWTSSNTGVLTVNSNGLVTAVGTGTATISATVNGTTGTSSTISVPTSPPIITQQPAASDDFLQGATLTASVSNIGTPPFVYRWFFNSGATPISTSANPTLTITNVQSGNAGTYTVVVSNLDGSVTSSNLVVSIISPTPYEQTVLQYGPVAYWPLQETSGSIAYDVIGGDNGTYTNFPSIGGSSVTLGQSGPSQSFFGGSSLSAGFLSAIADIPEGSLNITGAITIVAWVQQETAAQFGGVVGHGDNSWRMAITQNGAPGDGLAAGNDGSAQADATSSTNNNINDNNWHMVAYTYSGNISQANNGLLYVDGAFVASNTIAVTPPGDNLDVWIGGSPDYGTARLLPAANIAHVAVFNQSFTPAQVAGLYNGTFVLGPQTIHIASSGTNVVLTWQAGTLLQSTNVLGPWTTNNAAASPYTVPATNKAGFFRLLVNP